MPLSSTIPINLQNYPQIIAHLQPKIEGAIPAQSAKFDIPSDIVSDIYYDHIKIAISTWNPQKDSAFDSWYWNISNKAILSKSKLEGYHRRRLREHRKDILLLNGVEDPEMINSDTMLDRLADAEIMQSILKAVGEHEQYGPLVQELAEQVGTCAQSKIVPQAVAKFSKKKAVSKSRVYAQMADLKKYIESLCKATGLNYFMTREIEGLSSVRVLTCASCGTPKNVLKTYLRRLISRYGDMETVREQYVCKNCTQKGRG